MYSELIYTRCREGIDILKSGRPITSDGFKVYSCTSSLTEDVKTDLPFLFNAAQGKQPYADPAFMDDAYLYFVPDKGDAFMVGFHPIPYDASAKGDYSHRAGNFVNQILVGDYSGFYPFELFRDNTVWNAKGRGEAYYYETPPTPLLARNDIDDPARQISVVDLAAFIADGRKEALAAAVSFLIAQYEQPPESRKFLVIRDESSENIESWIAAIELAFSPRMASAIPFATRMDKFATANRYTVNQLGVYQTQINLQDPNQKQRYRAMIVGVDERDKTNSAAAKPLANSSFVLLDGKRKKADFEADVSHRYYRFITAFDEAHQTFCREFLQMFDVNTPSSEIFRLYDIYTALENSNTLPNAETMAEMISILSKYRVFNYPRFIKLYQRVTDNLLRFLQENLYSALQIIKWLQTAAQTVGDSNATEQLTETVCKVFEEQVFRKPDAQGTRSFWESIKNSEFASSAANYIVTATQQNYAVYQRFGISNAIAFVLIYIECATFSGNVQGLRIVIDDGMKFCARENDIKSAKKILKALPQSGQITAHDMLLSIAGKANKEYAGFIVKLLVEADDSIVASDASLLAFFKKLEQEKIEYTFVSVLKYRIRNLTGPADIEQFIKLVKEFQSLSSRDLAEIFEALDGRLVITKGSVRAAYALRREKPKEAVCPNSAHLYALEALNNRRNRPQVTSIIDIYKELEDQHFPSIDNPDYIQALTDSLFKVQMDEKELKYIIQLFARVPSYIAELIIAILDMTKPKRNKEWCILIAVAAKKDRAIDDAIVDACVRFKYSEKALSQLSDMLESKERDYFKRIADKANEIIRAQKPQSVLGKLFGGIFSGDDSDADRRERK